jgi:hypothetical protein
MITMGLVNIALFPIISSVQAQNASLPFTLDEIQDICQGGKLTEVPSLNCDYINRCLNYGSSISKCFADSKVTPPTTQTCPDGSVVSVNEACPPTDADNDENGDLRDESTRNPCIDYGILCQENMTKPAWCPTGPARDLLLRPECDMPFVFGRNNTNSTSP